MFTHQGIALDSWAKIEGECVIKYEVVGDEAQFRLGPTQSVLNLVFSERGLENLMAKASRALAEFKAL